MTKSDSARGFIFDNLDLKKIMISISESRMVNLHKTKIRKVLPGMKSSDYMDLKRGEDSALALLLQ